MKIGIVGCGKIAQKHVNFIRELDGTEIVGLADRDEQVLNLFSDSMNIRNKYANIKDLINDANPDIVHILTPPRFHKENALDAIVRGKHVYIEKPVVLNAQEAEEILDAAKVNGVKICPGYNHLFDPCMQKADYLIRSTELGNLIYLESHYGMNVKRKDLRSTTKDNTIPWSYELPGGLFHNYMDHPLCLLLNYIGKPKSLTVTTSSFGSLPQDLSDEIRILIEGEKITGLLVISFNIRPQLHHFHIYCDKGVVKVNFDTMTIVKHGISKLPKAASKATFNLNEAYQVLASTMANSLNLIKGKLKPYQGMKNLIAEFYQSIEKNTSMPISEEMILTMTQTMDEIWREAKGLKLNFTPRPSFQENVKKKERVLVTGASGFVGLNVVQELVAEGYYVRAFVRKLSYISALEKLGVEIFFGDIRNFESFDQAAKDMEAIIHLATDTSGDPKDSVDTAVSGTSNLIEIAKRNEIRKVIYMSSMSVYDPVHFRDGDNVSEGAILEPHSEKRGAYAHSKREAEKLVLEVLNDSHPAWTILRPAMIFGPNTDMFFGPIGISIGNKFRVVFGRGNGKLRLLHVEDAVKAIFLCLENSKSNGEIYNVVHEDMLTYREYLENFLIPCQGKGITVYIPCLMVYIGTFLLEWLSKIVGKKPFLTTYRLLASQRQLVFDTTKIRNDLSWKPDKPIRQQLKDSFAS